MKKVYSREDKTKMKDSCTTVDLDRIAHNAKTITEKYSDYKYFIGVLKSDAYGHGMRVVNELYQNGVNYFAVATIDEAKELRRYNKEAPVLLLEPIELSRISEAEQLGLTLPVNEIGYAKELLSLDRQKGLNIHLQVDSGFNRLGIKDKNEFKQVYDMLCDSVYNVEGVYQHFATAGIFDAKWDAQVARFCEITSLVELKNIPIVHMGSGVALLAHPKIDFANGIRMGLVMYGYNIAPSAPGNGLKDRLRSVRNAFLRKKYNISRTFAGVDIDLKPAMSLDTRILQIKDVKKGETVGYNAAYTAERDMKIAVLSVGYNNGIGHKNLGRSVEINGKRYPAVGEPGMNMMAVKVDGTVKKEDRVTLLGSTISLGMFSRSADMGLGESLMNVGKNNPRVYIKNRQKGE